MKRLIYTLFAAFVLVFGLSVLADAQSRPRGGGSSGGGGQAAPRGGSSGGGQSHASAPAPASQRGGSQGASVRPRGESAGAPIAGRSSSGRPIYGTAVPRSFSPNGRIFLPNRYYVSPYYYSPYAFGAFGLGYWGYDPFWWGSWWGGSPYWGWGSPYWGYGYPYGYPSYGYGYNYGYDESDQVAYREPGSLKLKVKPKQAEVYVDGYYVGQVDDFDGTFQHLDLASGTHKIEIRADGYQPIVLEMKIEPGRTVTYESDMRRAQ